MKRFDFCSSWSCPLPELRRQQSHTSSCNAPNWFISVMSKWWRLVLFLSLQGTWECWELCGIKVTEAEAVFLIDAQQIFGISVSCDCACATTPHLQLKHSQKSKASRKNHHSFSWMVGWWYQGKSAGLWGITWFSEKSFLRDPGGDKFLSEQRCLSC